MTEYLWVKGEMFLVDKEVLNYVSDLEQWYSDIKKQLVSAAKDFERLKDDKDAEIEKLERLLNDKDIEIEALKSEIKDPNNSVNKDEELKRLEADYNLEVARAQKHLRDLVGDQGNPPPQVETKGE